MDHVRPCLLPCSRCRGALCTCPQQSAPRSHKVSRPSGWGLSLALTQVQVGVNGTATSPQPVTNGNGGYIQQPRPWGGPSVWHVSEVSRRTEPQVPTMVTCSLTCPVPAPYPPCLPGSTSQMPHLHLNPHLSSASW